MQVIITMAGRGQRFVDAGATLAKPFIPVGNSFVLDKLIKSFSPEWKIIFAINEELNQTEYIQQLNSFGRRGRVCVVPYSVRGPLDTVKSSLDLIADDEPVIVSYCDYALGWNPTQFEHDVLDSAIDAAIVSYHGFHPTFLGSNSYCHLKVNAENEVEDLKEKELYTDHFYKEWTSAGLYFFKSGLFLKECLHQQETQGLACKNEFYTSLALLAMMKKNPDLKILNYPVEKFIQFGTPEDVNRYNYWYEKIILNKNQKSPNFKTVEAEENYWKDYFLKYESC